MSDGYVRGVSGWGARCGCGGKSTLHVGFGSPGRVTPDSSTFLCAECVVTAIEMLFDQRPQQPPYWPGDEGRDEHYIDPREAPSRGRTDV